MTLSWDSRSRFFEALGRIKSLEELNLEDHHMFQATHDMGHRQLSKIRVTAGRVFDHEFTKFISSYSHLTTVYITISPSASTRLYYSEDITLPHLSSLSIEAPSLSLLHRFTTPALLHLVVKLISGSWAEDDESDDDDEFDGADAIFPFISRSTTDLRSMTLQCTSNAAIMKKLLPSLSATPVLETLTLDLWPFIPTDERNLSADWLPSSLRELALSMGPSSAEDVEDIDAKRIEGLATVLKSRSGDARNAALQSLIVHRGPGNSPFPYEMFLDVNVGKLEVMVPLTP